MPPITSKNLLMSKLGADFVKAHEAKKGVEAKVDAGGEMPAGVTGIARLVECKITEIGKGKENEGKLMFYAAGVCVTPEFTESGIPIKGIRTQISEPIYDTPKRTRKTIAEHIEWVYAQLKALGLAVDKLGPDKIEEAMEALKKKQPFFRFRTFQPPQQTTGEYAGKASMIFHIWGGQCDYKQQKGTSTVKLGTPTQTNGTNAVTSSVTVDVVPSEPQPELPSNGVGYEEPEHVAPESLDMDIDSLAANAEAGDLEAGSMLQEQAYKLGLSQQQVKETKTWLELAALMKGGGKKDDEDGTVDVGDHFLIHPPGKDGTPIKTGIEVEITSINEEKDGIQTVNCKNVAKPSILYKNINVNDLKDIK